MKRNIRKVRGLTAWATVLVNGELDSLMPGDELELNEWLAEHGLSVEDCVDAGDDHYGTLRIGARLIGADVCTYTFMA